MPAWYAVRSKARMLASGGTMTMRLYYTGSYSGRAGPLSPLSPARINSFLAYIACTVGYPSPHEISHFQKDAYEFGTRFSDLHLYE